MQSRVILHDMNNTSSFISLLSVKFSSDITFSRGGKNWKCHVNFLINNNEMQSCNHNYYDYLWYYFQFSDFFQAVIQADIN